MTETYDQKIESIVKSYKEIVDTLDPGETNQVYRSYTLIEAHGDTIVSIYNSAREDNILNEDYRCPLFTKICYYLPLYFCQALENLIGVDIATELQSIVTNCSNQKVGKYLKKYIEIAEPKYNNKVDDELHDGVVKIIVDATTQGKEAALPFLKQICRHVSKPFTPSYVSSFQLPNPVKGEEVIEDQDPEEVLEQKWKESVVKIFDGENREEIIQSSRIEFLFGPANNGSSMIEKTACCYITGCRMLTCCCLGINSESSRIEEVEENDVVPPNFDWFQYECQYCRRAITSPSNAWRYPKPQGSWKGCYCSVKCVKSYFLNTLTNLPLTDDRFVSPLGVDIEQTADEMTKKSYHDFSKKIQDIESHIKTNRIQKY